ncbi:MAG: VPLPA-CTERM-specific exosortase XrtD [Pseudomonadota bacterium]
MTFVDQVRDAPRLLSTLTTWGMFWLLIAVAGAGIYFVEGIEKLLLEWQRPEYSHGPLIPVLSGLLFLRQLKDVPVQPGPVHDRWVGTTVVFLAITVAALGKLSGIDDIVAYALILWVGGILLISFGWKVGRQFWPPVLHLVYMLPLPDTFYYKMSTQLQLISSELGVWFLKLMSVPVFLDGNIIDLGVYKLHVAEACSGLRYLFPILSFSYIFAVLYRGPMWHKAVLLLAAAPITVLMNSVRIAIAGVMVNQYGVGWVEGFTHFFEGWVIFLSCVLILFALARFMLIFNPKKMSLAESLDLDTDGLGTQFMRLQYLRPSKALMTAAMAGIVAAAAWQFVPETNASDVDRESFASFPRDLEGWRQQGPRNVLDPAVAEILGADDYHSVDLVHPEADAPVDLFMAWYADQTDNGVHSPEICLPGAGWEIAWLERADIAPELGQADPFNLNRAIIQRGQSRMMVLYWFEQRGRRVAWDLAAKFYLMVDGMTTRRTDGAMLRLTTPILPGESDAAAEARLLSVLKAMQGPLPRFLPENPANSGT